MARRRVWQGGWWQPARRVESPNQGLRPGDQQPTLVVVHSISLPPGRYAGDAVRRLFTNTLDIGSHPYFEGLQGLQVSAHFFIRRSGRVTQFVSCERRAWHAGVSVWQGRENCNDYSVGVELEGLEGDRFEPAQYRQLARVVQALTRHYPISGVVGHEHVAPGRKADPGPGFEWMRLARLLQDGSPRRLVLAGCN